MQNTLNWLAYEFGFRLSQLTLVLGWSIRVTGRHHIPRTGPALLIANHQSFIDPLAVGVGCQRHLAYLARKPLFTNRAFGTYLRMVNTVPIDQEGVAKEGIRAILNRLHDGWPVLVFPEGSRTSDGEMLPLQPGISLLIKRVGAPIIPVGIAGSHEAWRRGTPLPVPSPIFLPRTKRSIGVAFGPPRPAASVAHLPRDQMLAILDADIRACVERAEELRKPKNTRSSNNRPRLAHQELDSRNGFGR